MDPNACLARLIAAAKENRDEYVAACEDLADWLRRGGFAPTVPEGTKYIPGTNTAWSLVSPADDQYKVWTLVRYGNGRALESFALKG